MDIFTPHIAPILSYFIDKPKKEKQIKRQMHQGRKMCCSTPIATQKQLNEMYVGEEFDLPIRIATILNTLGVVMCYSAALPAMIPIAFINITLSYIVDKFFILKLYKRPPRFQLSLMSSALTLIPLLVVAHLYFSILIYTEKTMFPEMTVAGVFSSLGIGSSDQASAIESAKSTANTNDDQSSFTNRSTQGHVLPLLVLFVLIVTMEVLNFIFSYIIPLSAIMSFLRTCACSVVYFNCCGTRYKRNTKPPFSEVYACPFRTNQDIENATLTELETRIGYEKRYFGPEGKQKLSKVKLRRDPKTKKKVFERTWEVIKDTTGQYSYNIRANPEYGAHLK